MRRLMDSRTSPALIVAILALVAGLTGAAVADPAAKKVTTKKVKKIADKEIKKLAPGLSVANADQLGGVAASGYQQRVRWAFVSDNGTIVAQSGGISNNHHPGGCPTGCDVLDFGSSQAGKAITATPTRVPGNGNSLVTVGLCGDASGLCPPALNDANHVAVITTDTCRTSTRTGPTTSP